MTSRRRWLAGVALVAACGSVRPWPVSAQRLQSLALADPKSGCTISSSPVAFGNYDVMNSSPLLGRGTITYSCTTQSKGGDGAVGKVTPIANVTIELSRGSSSSFDRAMTQGVYRLRYNLYLDANATQVWGDGSQGTVVYTQSNPQNQQSYSATIFGRVFDSQDVAPGLYQDNITATINF